MVHSFEVSKEIELAATPEQVWEAIATGPGIDAWFMGRNAVEPRAGGTASLRIGGGPPQESVVTAWEPGRRFATRTPESPEGRVMAFEYLIEGRDGGSTVLRLVHSGFLGDDWETEFDALRKGWPMYLHTLGEYLAHFNGRRATPVFAAQPQSRDAAEVRAILLRALGIDHEPKQGERVHCAPEGLPAFDGVVDYLDEDFLGVRTEDALYRFIHGFMGTAVVGHHLFGAVEQPEKTEAAWQAWLSGLYA